MPDPTPEQVRDDVLAWADRARASVITGLGVKRMGVKHQEQRIDSCPIRSAI